MRPETGRSQAGIGYEGARHGLAVPARAGDLVNRSAHRRQEPFQRLPRSFRLKKRTLIQPLFDRSRDDVGTVTRGVIRILYRIVPRSAMNVTVPLQVGFAPGRLGSAVRRNRVRRVLRAVYRIHQEDLVRLFADSPFVLTVMILYREGPDKPEKTIRRDLPVAMSELERRLRGETSVSAELRG